ncbi:hypothetical protein C8F04DRAFT_1198425 [Mycena alexandri]|uniref:Uncharacterized protein n=1 Tax=Mycena alexandri TaxID=1745969 RepID=A0AAD6S213_9AGAR|nr:hypothetical protein C8F04DRAFT_1198425 [Mycena alexandri]
MRNFHSGMVRVGDSERMKSWLHYGSTGRRPWRETFARGDPTNIPEGFIAVNDHPTEIWSKAAFEHIERLRTEEENRDPDAHGLYIYNDYFGYACSQARMLAIGKLISKKTEKLSVATFQRLEALTLYMANSMGASDHPASTWGLNAVYIAAIDDPDLAEAIYDAYGTLWMTYILDLESAAKPQKLGPTHPVAIPNLENVVRTSAKGVDAMLRVLERNDMDGTPQEQLFLGDSDDSDSENEDGDEEERPKKKKDTRPAKKGRRTGADDTDVRSEAKAWKASAAMKALREAYGPVEHGGRPWDITKC